VSPCYNSQVAQYEPNLAQIAALIGDPVRSRMLLALLDGRELIASELAFRANASPQSASGHLSKLVAGGLLIARSAGRQRLFRLASADVAGAIETLATIAPLEAVASLDQHTAMQRMGEARSCYDHLAGRLGVGVTQALQQRGVLALRGDDFRLTAKGGRFFVEIGIDVEHARAHNRSFARACMDWTERRPHLAGSLGAALLDHVLKEQWVRRSTRDRSLLITPAGRQAFANVFGLT